MESAKQTGSSNAWEELLWRVVRLATSGGCLILAIGQSARQLQPFVVRLTDALPPDLPLRRFVVSPGNLNPFIDLERNIDRGQYMTLVSGLLELSPEQRKQSLQLMNRNRGLLTNGPARFILWVEVEIFPELYRYAGDFADWWDTIVEIPGLEGTPALSAAEGTSSTLPLPSLAGKSSPSKGTSPDGGHKVATGRIYSQSALKTEARRDLRKILSNTFGNPGEIRMLLSDVGLNERRIDFDRSAEAIWADALTQAARAERLEQLLEYTVELAPALSEVPAVRSHLGLNLGLEALEPRYADPDSRALSEAYQQALERVRRLREVGADEAALEPAREEAARLKRRLREGRPLLPGDVFDERWLVLERVGQGGFATVWKASDLAGNDIVALKVLRGDYAMDRTHRERFEVGVRAMASLEHPHIVRVLAGIREEQGYPLPDASKAGRYIYYVMEYVPGGDFQSFVRRQTPPPQTVLHVGIEVASALEYAHSRGYVHRDVKPSNILLTTDGHARLTDFDLARVQESTHATRTGALGTVFYAPPELHESAGSRHVDGRADIYSLAMTMTFGLLGGELDYRVLRRLEDTLNELPIPERLRQELHRALAIEPAERQRDMADFRKALELGLALMPIADTPHAPSTTSALDIGSDLDTPRLPRRQDRDECSTTATARLEHGPSATKRAPASRWRVFLAVLALILAGVVLLIVSGR